MSISVYKTENLQMGYKFLPRKNRKPIEKARRLLFGRVNPEDEEKFIQNSLERDYSRNCAKWNFNFRDEKTLDPEGDFIWAPASPVHINRKRKPTEIADHSSDYYFSPLEVGSSYLFKPIEPVARSSETQSKAKVTTQSLITDYMAKTKRQVVYSKDTSMERPKKIPKLGDLCSS